MRMAAIYARVSSEQQREENTIASQTALLIEFAKSHDLESADDVQRNATRSFLRHPILRSKMKKNRMGTQVWPSVTCSTLSSRILNGTAQGIAVRDRKVFIAFC